MVLTVTETGPLSTIQDLGRPGWFDAGVGVSGAADRPALELANRLVANNPGAAGIEVLLGGLELTVDSEVLIAVTGADAPVTVDGTTVGHNSIVRVAAGSRIALGYASHGLRTYVAVRGGITVEPVLGSRSYDTLSRIGPPPLAAGTVLPVGNPPPSWPTVELAPVAAPRAGTVVVSAIPGPRDDWFDNPDDLYLGRWTVTDRTDRIGARLHRLTGPPLRRRAAGEMGTEGMPLGAIQIPPSGEPVVFLADHPITGGYPVIGTVVYADVPKIAQARVGQGIRFVKG